MTTSLEKIAQTLLQLPREERRQFADWFYQHEARLTEPSEVEDTADDLSEEQKAEMIHCRHLAEAHPELLAPWDAALAHIHQQFQAHHQPNPPAR